MKVIAIIRLGLSSLSRGGTISRGAKPVGLLVGEIPTVELGSQSFLSEGNHINGAVNLVGL